MDFEERCTEITDKAFSGLFRQIIEYKFGGLNCLVRFSLDCVDYERSFKLGKPKLLLPSDLKPISNEDSNLYIKHLGNRMNYHLIELSSRATKAGFIRHPSFWKMYFSSTNSLVIGYHEEGFCRNVVRHAVSVSINLDFNMQKKKTKSCISEVSSDNFSFEHSSRNNDW